MKRSFFLLLCSLSLMCSANEALFVRRITQLCSEGERTLARNHIASFLETYPESREQERLLALLGDIALSEKNYPAAVEAYERITSLEGKRNVRIRRWHALYQDKQFEKLYEETSPCLSWLDEEGRFYFAESCFRQALALLTEDKEAACALCLEALPHYAVEDPRFATHAAMARGEIFRILGRHEEAAKCFYELAHCPERLPQEVRLHAGVMLAQFEPESAMAVLEALTREGSTEAATSWFHLLAQAGEWKLLAQEKELFLSYLPKEQLPHYHYALGKTLFEAQDYPAALEALTQCLETSSCDQRLLTLLMLCCRETGALSTLEKAYALYKEHYGEETKYAIVRILAYRDAGEPGHALALLEESGLAMPSERLRLEVAIALKEHHFERLTTIIEKGLALVEGAEERTLRLLLAKTYLSLGKTQTAALHLKEHMRIFGACAESHALLALCSPELLLPHGEAALRLDPTLKTLHLHLFNAYVAQGEEEKAATHLSAVLDSDVPLENRLWLAYYYERRGALPRQIIPLLEPLCESPELFEKELILLASLYEQSSAQEKALTLLEMLGSREAQLAKAHLLMALGDTEKALPLFQELETSSAEAKLAVARLLFAQLPPEAHTSRDPEALSILRRLEDLTLSKRLASEPIHFEAALDHAAFRAQLAPAEHYEEVLLQQLHAVRQEFTTQEDLLSRDYHASMCVMPDKERLYQAYLRYLDASIFLLEGHLAARSGNLSIGEAKEKAAHALFVSLSQGNEPMTKYLVEKASAALYCN